MSTRTPPRPHRAGHTRKKSVSLPEETAQRIEDRVGERGFSRYITDAVEEKLRSEAMGEFLAQYEAEHGPLSEEQVREAAAEWPDVTP